MTNMINQIASEVARNLSTVKILGGSAFISTPLTYIGGSTVVVRLDSHGDKFFVSDAGLGLQEADFMGGAKIFKRIAPDFASRFGVNFDKNAFFEAETIKEELIPAVIAIANASCRTLEAMAFRIAEKSTNDSKLVMLEKLSTVFRPENVIIDYVLRGASNDEWNFDSAVKLNDHLTLFQVVTPSAISVYGAASRFLDISDLPDLTRPTAVAVIQDRAKTTHLKLIERSARTIDINAEASVWERAVAA